MPPWKELKRDETESQKPSGSAITFRIPFCKTQERNVNQRMTEAKKDCSHATRTYITCSKVGVGTV